MRALGFAAMLLLMVNPALIFDVGFQMSFAAVLALLAGYEAARPVTAWFHGEGIGRRIALHVLQLFLTSLIAGAASLPYAAFHFGRVQFYFVLANLLAVPLTAFWVMPQGLLSLGLMAVRPGLDHVKADGRRHRHDPVPGAPGSRFAGGQPGSTGGTRLGASLRQLRADVALPLATALALSGGPPRWPAD